MSRLDALLAAGASERALLDENDGGRRVDAVWIAERVAALARELGATPPGTLVALHLRNEPALVVALLACLAARRPFVPIDPAWRQDERRYAAARAAPSLHLARDDEADAPRDTWRIDRDGALSLRPCGASASTRDDLGGVAVVHWSSGTSGRPKPIVVERAALAARIESVAAAFAMRGGDRVLAMVPLAHCHGLDCIALPALASGAELVLLDPFAATPERVTQLAAERRLTHVSALPRFWEQLRERGVDAAAWSSVREPLCGSAALRPATAAALERELGRPIRTGYGVTEIGVISLRRPPDGDGHHASVGRVLPGIDWRIEGADAEGVGQLVVRGPGLARVDDSGVDRTTPPRFVEGWLRTQDLVRTDADGRLQLVGRLSSLINVNGAKVDPGEVEAAIAELPWIAEAAVKGVADGRGGETVAAWIVPRGGDGSVPAHGAPSELAGALRSAIVARLAPWKVPTRVVVVAALPRTPLGKVAYARLECEEQDPSAPSAPLIHAEGRAEGPTERAVAAAWCDVLKRDDVGSDEEFFAAGGDSVALVQLVERLRRLGGRELTLLDLFRWPTVRAQAAALAPSSASNAATVRVPEGAPVGAPIGAILGRDRGAAQRAALARRQREAS